MVRQICPHCKKELDEHTEKTGAKPQPGDCSVCLYCGSILVFKDDLSLRIITHTELEQIKSSEPNVYTHLMNYSLAATIYQQIKNRPE